MDLGKRAFILTILYSCVFGTNLLDPHNLTQRLLHLLGCARIERNRRPASDVPLEICDSALLEPGLDGQQAHTSTFFDLVVILASAVDLRQVTSTESACCYATTHTCKCREILRGYGG
jgi:hypothetical protein